MELQAKRKVNRNHIRKHHVFGQIDSKIDFETLNEKLLNPPIVAYADYSLPFSLHTDASSVGLGAVLCQKKDEQVRVVSFASTSLKPSEKNYPAHKLEFLALKWSITEKFHDYLYAVEEYFIPSPVTYACRLNTSDCACRTTSRAKPLLHIG